MIERNKETRKNLELNSKNQKPEAKYEKFQKEYPPDVPCASKIKLEWEGKGKQEILLWISQVLNKK